LDNDIASINIILDHINAAISAPALLGGGFLVSPDIQLCPPPRFEGGGLFYFLHDSDLLNVSKEIYGMG